MAIAFDLGSNGSSSPNNTPSNSITWNHTCSGSNRYILVAGFVDDTGASLTATCGGSAMTAIDNWDGIQAGSGYWTNRIYLWGYIAPAAASNTIVVSTVSGNYGLAGVSASYTGVHQTTPYGTPSHWADGNSGYTSPSSQSISSDSAHLVIQANTDNYGDSVFTATGTGQTVRGSLKSQDAGGHFGNSTGGIRIADLPGAATTTASYTWTVRTTEYYSWTMVALNAAATGPAVNLIYRARQTA
jgi:hypothetical protein